MHLDHDHIPGHHVHEHTHDGVTHTHEHSHEHPHEHDHDHEHTATPKEELVALMKYMVGHNASHARELSELAGQFKDAGNDASYEKVMAAVAEFDKGNAILSEALKELGE